MFIPQDYHIHTAFSEDGTSPPETMCRQAISLKIPEIGFSEHWDVGPYEKNPYYFQPESWYTELCRLRTLFAGKLTIRAGIEIAEPHLYRKETTAVLALIPFDYVLGSVHWVGSHFMFDDEYFSRTSADEVYLSYFTELQRMVTVSDIDIVAHLDIPTRTAKPILGFDPFRYEQQIRNCLQIIIQRGLSLDINTAGYQKPANNLMPDPQILSWYVSMGGTKVTLGSDAHQDAQIGTNFEKAISLLRDLQLTHVVTYEHRRAIPVLLPALG